MLLERWQRRKCEPGKQGEVVVGGWVRGEKRAHEALEHSSLGVGEASLSALCVW